MSEAENGNYINGNQMYQFGKIIKRNGYVLNVLVSHLCKHPGKISFIQTTYLYRYNVLKKQFSDVVGHCTVVFHDNNLLLPSKHRIWGRRS